MENLKKYDGFELKTDKKNGIIITAIAFNNRVSHKDNIEWRDKTIVAANVYQKDQTYNVVYLIVDLEGNVEDIYLENGGIMPTLFKSPDDEPYASIVIYDPNKRLETSVPLINRQSFEETKPNKEFAGKYIGNANQSAIFHDADIFSDKKQDKILNIEFKNGKIKKRHNIKVDFPKDNKICISDNEIHLFGKDKNLYIHRQIDEFGKEIRRREINLDKYWCRETLLLSFEDNSYIIGNKQGEILLIEIDQKGEYKAKVLIDIKDQIYNTFSPTRVGKAAFAIRYNTQFGNGWFTINSGELAEFYYGKGGKGYKNLLTNETIEIGSNNLIIEGLNKTTDNAYAVIFSENNDNKREIIVLNKKI